MTGPNHQPEPSFLSLLDTHAGLAEQFLRHQEARHDSDLARAAALLREFERGLQDHAEKEEALLLPVYARVPAAPGGGADLFRAEHRKMLRFTAEFAEALAELHLAGPNLKRRILTLLDRQAAFKSLVDHHDRREARFLYPALDAVTTLDERRDLLGQCGVG